jgi:hypothetical protein
VSFATAGSAIRLSAHHRFVDSHAVAHKVLPRRNELLERRLDIVEVDVGDEPVNAGVDAGRVGSVYISVSGNEIGEYPQISEAADISGLWCISADALEMVALKIEFARANPSSVRLGCSRISAARNAGQ